MTTWFIILRADVAVAEGDEGKPGEILQYEPGLVGTLDASKRVTEARRIEFEMVG
jgi:hypothetical protein